MATDRKKKPRIFTHGHRQRWDRAVEHYLLECYREHRPARAKEFARSLELTPEYASWLGGKILGESLSDFLREKQLAYAARLLRTTPLSVHEIALRCGFGSRSTLHRRFLELHGMTPGAFRELKK